MKVATAGPCIPVTSTVGQGMYWRGCCSSLSSGPQFWLSALSINRLWQPHVFPHPIPFQPFVSVWCPLLNPFLLLIHHILLLHFILIPKPITVIDLPYLSSTKDSRNPIGYRISTHSFWPNATVLLNPVSAYYYDERSLQLVHDFSPEIARS
jgi:hypothetical protein